jgi:hypothetical protein
VVTVNSVLSSSAVLHVAFSKHGTVLQTKFPLQFSFMSKLLSCLGFRSFDAKISQLDIIFPIIVVCPLRLVDCE